MGWFDSVCNFVSSTVSSVCSTVCTVVTSAANLVREVGSMAVEGIRGVAAVICNIGRALGFIEAGENPEELGDKIIQAQEQGITLDSCEGDYKAYMEKIRNFKVDPERSKTITENDKLVATSVVVGARIEDHYGTSIAPLVPLIGRMPEFFNGGRLKSLLDSGMPVSKISDYFGSKLNLKQEVPIEAELIVNEKKMAPNADQEKLRDMLRSMQE